jgi:lipopolysaccharide heptosyltransferase II
MNGSWEDARHVLCVRLDTIGDVLMTTPALRALRDARPGRRLTLLTSSVGRGIGALVPEVDDVIAFDAVWLKPSAERADPGPERTMIDLLRARSFEAAAIFTVYSQSPLPAALLCHLAGIPLRLAHCRENPYGLLTDWVREPEPERFVRHEVRRQLDLVAAVGATAGDERLSLDVPPKATRRVGALLAAEGLDDGGAWALVHPGATAPSRRYPSESFAAACDLLAASGCRVVLSGAPAEGALVERVRLAAAAPVISLAGRLDLPELAALIAAAPVLVANNSGPVHMACALGTPVVDLYALTNPQHTPWRAPARVLSHDVACRWCYRSVCPEGHHDCLRLVAPGDVARAALELLEETGVGALSAAPRPPSSSPAAPRP